VEFLPGREGMAHISQLVTGRQVEDEVAVGDRGDSQEIRDRQQGRIKCLPLGIILSRQRPWKKQLLSISNLKFMKLKPIVKCFALYFLLVKLLKIDKERVSKMGDFGRVCLYKIFFNKLVVKNGLQVMHVLYSAEKERFIFFNT